MNDFQNGRVIFDKDKRCDSFPLFDKMNKNVTKNNFEYQAMIGIFEPNQLNTIYFSRENLNNVQAMLRYNVYIKSNKKHIIGNQSEVELQILMRSMFLQHSPNLRCKIKEQIRYINQMVVDWATPKILSEIEQYIGYIYQLEHLPVPQERSKNLSSKGTKTLKSVTTTF